MRGQCVVQYGAPLRTEVRDVPAISSREVLIRVRACALNFGDLLLIKGSYQEKPALPFVLGMEFSGDITAIGADVKDLRVGDRVLACNGTGGLADYAAVAGAVCHRIPDTMSHVNAAAFPVAYGTAHVGLDYRARLVPGERLIVTGAAGGVGLTAVELGTRMGAEVVAVARGAAKLDIARAAGAIHTLDSDTTDLREAVKALGGADVVYDVVGGEQFRALMRATNPDGRLIPLGFASGTVPQIPANHLLVKNLTVIGYYWGGYARVNPKVLHSSMKTLLGWWEAGDLNPRISHVLPFDQANEALDLLRTRTATGKVVVEIG
ncbi:MAG: NADPH:quinone oxidoreductase family protein [Rhodobacteraceae bacterium]|nr:NADPH:quinone oxidoreductase family protein [Paracoccaceae bacterium]